jgi:glycosyltransferase involved in cell wall biosynthesis
MRNQSLPNPQTENPLNLVFLSAQPHCGSWSRQSHDIQAWAAALQADTYNFCRLNLWRDLKNYRIALLEITVPHLHLAPKLKKKYPDLILIGVQEGSLHSPDNTYSTADRLKLIEAFRAVDALGVLLEDSIAYFQSLTDKPVFWLGVPFPVEWAKQCLVSPDKKPPTIEIPTSLLDSKAGLTNFFALRTIQQNHPEFTGIIYSRNPKNEAKLCQQFGVKADILPATHIWQEYFTRHARAGIGLHLDYRWSWNRYVLDCAGAGIPCISTPHSTVQQTLFPELMVEPFDIRAAKNLAEKLIKDPAFYQACRHYALEKIGKFTFENSARRLKEFLSARKWI